MSDNSHRLPSGVVPTRYDLRLAPDLDSATFSGEVTIQIRVSTSTDHITLHSLDLAISSASLSTGADTHDMVIDLDPEHELVVLRVDHEIPAGEATVSISFDGVLNDQLVGFYRSTFRTESADGATDEHTIAVTQFESTHARRAFPCFDEPAMKAIFAITLDIDPSLLVVANSAEIAREELDTGLVRVSFADTIAMSTYLVAFVIGPLESTPVRLVAGVDRPIPLRVIHPPGTAELCGFALDVAEAALEYFERYYELAYPGDKVDLVALPDFAFGAMENLGCITFREVLLLVDPERATQTELQRVADVINHELAHMWFGDLVTMSWWNGIWLNEAFATFMEVMATDSFRPEWDVWTTFGLARAAAFDTDSLESTRPIEFPVVTAADAEGMFDILTYEKGASVVRMLEQYLGAEQFRRGIVTYLTRHACANTDTSDLWDALEEVTGEPVRRIMDSWIFRGGHPLVNAKVEQGRVQLTQQRSRYGDPDPRLSGGQNRHDDAPWPVPMVLCIGTDDGDRHEQRVLLEEPVELSLGRPITYLQANVGGAGFYRVGLDDSLRLGLLDLGDPDPLERFVLLDDTWAGVLSGHVRVTEVVALLTDCAINESDPSVWRRIASIIRELTRLVGADHRDEMSSLARRLALPHLAGLTTADPPEIGPADAEMDEHDRDRRGVLFSLGGVEGEDADLRMRARDLWDSTGDTTLRAAATAVVAASATTEEHAELERRWRRATTPQEELRFLNALVDTSDPVLFARTLGLALTDVRTQNAPYLLRRALDHPDLGAEAWRFVADNWDRITGAFPSNSIPRMLGGLRLLTDPATAESATSFVSDEPDLADSMQVAQHLERMHVSVRVAELLRAELQQNPGILRDAQSNARPGTRPAPVDSGRGPRGVHR